MALERTTDWGKVSNKEDKYSIKDESGNVIRTEATLPDDVSAAVKNNQPVYMLSDGTLTPSPQLYVTPSITLNKDTGNIQIKAPDSIFTTETYKKQMKPFLESLSQAYKLNPDYKYPDPDDDSKEYTVDELVARQQKALEEMVEDEKKINAAREETAGKWAGVRGLNAEQMAIALTPYTDTDDIKVPGTTRISMPAWVLDTEEFGPLKDLASFQEADGNISVTKDDFMTLYDRDRIGQEEMAHLVGKTEAMLNSKWTDEDGNVHTEWSDEDYIETEDGELIKNKVSKTEMAKTIAFRNLLLGENPHAEWWQQVGDNVATLYNNVTSAAATTMAGAANLGEAVLTFGQGHTVDNWIADVDEAYEQFNERQALVNSATGVMATLGQIGGMILGNVLLSKGASIAGEAALGAVEGVSPVSGLTKASAAARATAAEDFLADMITKNGSTILSTAIDNLKTAKTINAVSNVSKTLSGAAAVKSSIDIASNISAGAKFMLRVNSIQENVALAANVARTVTQSNKFVRTAVSFLADTLTDAMITDSHTFRQILENTDDQQTKDYLIQQFTGNLKAWGVFHGAGVALKWAGKTVPGRMLNVTLAAHNAKVSAKIGEIKYNIKSKATSEKDLITHLETKRNELVKNRSGAKADRVQNKIEILQQQKLIREQKKALSNIKIHSQEGDTLLKKLNLAEAKVTEIKAINNAIDTAEYGIQRKMNEMFGKHIDPDSKTAVYIYADLGKANARVDSVRDKWMSIEKKYGLEPSATGVYSQPATDYMMASYEHGVAVSSVGSLDGEKAAKAQEAAEKLAEIRDKAGALLPEELKALIDNEALPAYKNFYEQINTYASSKNLINKDKLADWRSSKVHQDNGYIRSGWQMPEQVGKFQRNDGQLMRTLEVDVEERTFNVRSNFVDPETMRASYSSTVASAEISQEIIQSAKASVDASKRTIVSGYETEYERKVSYSQKQLDKTVQSHIRGGTFGEGGFVIRTDGSTPAPRRAMDKYQRSSAISGLDNEQTNIILEYAEYDPNLNIENITEDLFDDWRSNLNKDAKKFLDSRLEAYGDISYGSLQEAMKYEGDTFVSDLSKAQLIGDTEFAKSDVLKTMVNDWKESDEFILENLEKAANRDSLRVKGLDGNSFVKQVEDSVDAGVEDVIDSAMDNSGVKGGIEKLAEEGDGVSADAAGRYSVIKELGKKANRDNIYASIDKEIDEAVKGKGIDSDDVEKMKQRAHRIVDDTLDSKLDEASKALRDAHSPLLKRDDVFDRANELHKKIQSSKKAIWGTEGALDDIEYAAADQSMIMYLDENGHEVFAQVDPALAGLYNYRYKYTNVQASVVAKVNAQMSKAFRLGTTIANLTSFGNQAFRDSGNALLLGGAFSTIRRSAENIRSELGDSVTDRLLAFDPSGYELKQVQSIAEETGKSLTEAATARELARGASRIKAETEVALYRNFMEKAYGDNSTRLLKGLRDNIKKFTDKYSVDQLMNGKREEYLRNRVFANNYAEATRRGYSMAQARAFADFATSNATTNFGRTLYHMQAIGNSTPYFSAAINGTKSFWRMWELDPVAISGRMLGGLVFPIMFLTGQSLATDENREAYKNHPEYEKDNNILFVVNGQAMSIPIPQELGALVAPARQFVESMYDANQNDFWELMAYDAIGLSPLDFKGFSAIDWNKVADDPTFLDRMGRGFSRLFAQAAPVAIKDMYMTITGVDPYTGKSLYDPEYAYYDENIGKVVTMDNNQNAFATFVAKMFPKGNSKVIEKVVSSTLGNTGSLLLGTIATAFSGNGEDAISGLGEGLLNQATSPFTAETYNRLASDWREEVRAKEAEKDALLDENSETGKKLAEINKQLQKVQDTDTRQKLLNQRADIIADYQNGVAEMVQRLQDKWGGTFDKYKFAAVIQLLNFDTSQNWVQGNAASISTASDDYFGDRGEALRTMERLGISSVNDVSVFGYIKTDYNTGEAKIAYSSPTAILNLQNIIYGAADINRENIDGLIKNNALSDGKKAMKNQVDAIFNKGKLSDSDYDAVDAIYVNWNAQVMKALEPYISRMSPEAVLGDAEIMDKIAKYIYPPGDYKVDKRGYHVTNTSLAGGSAREAYVRKYIKEMYKMNDTSYAGGKDYSGRNKE